MSFKPELKSEMAERSTSLVLLSKGSGNPGSENGEFATSQLMVGRFGMR